jgi:hypothetical protein
VNGCTRKPANSVQVIQLLTVVEKSLLRFINCDLTFNQVLQVTNCRVWFNRQV